MSAASNTRHWLPNAPRTGHGDPSSKTGTKICPTSSSCATHRIVAIVRSLMSPRESTYERHPLITISARHRLNLHSSKKTSTSIHVCASFRKGCITSGLSPSTLTHPRRVQGALRVVLMTLMGNSFDPLVHVDGAHSGLLKYFERWFIAFQGTILKKWCPKNAQMFWSRLCRSWSAMKYFWWSCAQKQGVCEPCVWRAFRLGHACSLKYAILIPNGKWISSISRR